MPKKDAPDEIVLVLAADKEQRIAREDVEEVQPGKVSIMPAGLDKQLTPQELADLIAFLRGVQVNGSPQRHEGHKGKTRIGQDEQDRQDKSHPVHPV